MDDINQLVSTNLELEKLNAYRLHLQVIFLSDITKQPNKSFN